MYSKKKFASYVVLGRCIKLCSVGFVFGASGEILTPGSNIVNGQVIIQNLIDAQTKTIPSSYKYITVLYTGVQSGTKEYDTLQQAIYLGLIPNKTKTVNLSRPLTTKSAQRLIKTLLNQKIMISGSGQLHYQDIAPLIKTLSDSSGKDLPKTPFTENNETLTILQDAYFKIHENYLHANDVSDKELIQGAIKGMAQATKDPYTVYFPPNESQSFSDSMQGEFVGIGAYIEMSEPGKLTIISPIEGTPASLAGLLAGDQVMKINDELVTDAMDINTAVSKIKGPENTTVKLTILRDKQEIIKEIVRKKVTIKPLTLKELGSDKVLVSISMFQFGLDNLFAQAIDEIMTKGYSTIVIDLRNNPGGSLDDVEHMLNYIVPKGSPSVIVKTNTTETPYLSEGVATGIEIMNKKIIILINKGSASASEIMAGVMKEYGTNVTLVGEKSFGKGTVQSIRDYSDGSSIKITIAKRLMGKSKTSIDKTGVKPDKEIIDDPKTANDEVLDYIKSL